MKKAVAYYRVSSKGQGKSGLGLDAQRQAVRNFAFFNKMKIVAEFTGTISAQKKNRHMIADVLEECKNLNATLLFSKVDRLTRRLLFMVTLMEEGIIPFICVEKPHADEYELHMDAAYAQRESKLISQRTRDALQAAKRRGIKLGTAIKWLLRKRRLAYKAFAKKLKPKIQHYRKHGCKSVRALADILNRKHIKTFAGGECKWHVSTVHRLLKEIKGG